MALCDMYLYMSCICGAQDVLALAMSVHSQQNLIIIYLWNMRVIVAVQMRNIWLVFR